MKPWESRIPQPVRRRDRKRCYTVWTRWGPFDSDLSLRSGGKVVWLTDAQLTFAKIKYPDKEFDEVFERDTLEECKKYLHQTIE
jgi:hypothetical protein